MKKRHNTVLQNSWSQKKTNTFIEKTILALKNTINSYEKTTQHRLTKCLKPKKSNTLIEKTLPALKTL